MVATWDEPQRRCRTKDRRRNKRREEVYRYIINFADHLDGPTPNIREIADALHIDYRSAHYHVLMLIEEGLLRREKLKLVVVGSEWLAPNSQDV